jgi:hypothetical protein
MKSIKTVETHLTLVESRKHMGIVGLSLREEVRALT